MPDPGTNWAGNYAYSAQRVLRPRSIEELSDVVARAEHVRALGSRHSFNDLADSPGDLVALLDLPADIDVDVTRQVARVAGGVTYGRLATEFHRAGWGLAGMASLPHITVAGAIATGTHGSGVTVGSLSSAVCALELVTPDGELRTIRRGEPTFEGQVVSLGALGVVTHVSLDIVPTFEVRQDVFLGLGWDDLFGHIEAILECAYSVSIFTDWTDAAATQVWVKSKPGADAWAAPPVLAEVALATTPTHMLRDAPLESLTAQLGEVGPWHERLPHFRAEFTPSRGEELQSEYFVPRRHAADACSALLDLGGRIGPLLQVTEIRTVAADRLWLSGAYDADVVGLHFTWVLDPPGVHAVLPAVEAALRPYRARPHWGKCFTLESSEFAQVHPRLADFASLRDQLDPGGKFGNTFLDRIGV